MMIVSAYGFFSVLGPHVILDPSRVAAQVVSGIGFLGAGSIILRNEVVKGLTTAASLWAVAAIGLAVRRRFSISPWLVVATTAIILIILAGLKPLEERFRGQRQAAQIRLEVKAGALSVSALQALLGMARGTRPARSEVKSQAGDATETVTLTLAAQPTKDTDEMVRILSLEPSVVDVRQL